MKKLILAVTLLIALQVSAQEKPKGQQSKKMEHFKDLSNEQLANLKTKKMTLQLDLTNQQINSVYAINLDLIKERRAKMNDTKKDKSTLSANERYAKQVERLEKQIAIKKQLQQILTVEQMEKLEKSRAMKHRKKRKRMHSRKNS